MTCHDQLSIFQSPQHVVSSRLRNLLKLPKAHKWCYYEWFYSDIDQSVHTYLGVLPPITLLLCLWFFIITIMFIAVTFFLTRQSFLNCSYHDANIMSCSLV